MTRSTLGLLALALTLTACNTTTDQQQAAVGAGDSTITTAQADSQQRAARQEALADNARRAKLAEADRYWDDAARLLAGMTPREGSTLQRIDTLAVAKTHAEKWEGLWKKKQERFLTKVESWAAGSLAPERAEKRNVFYPFAGSDFLTVDALYPEATRFVLFGLEPEGSLPDLRTLPKERVGKALENLRVSIDDIMGLSFFKTKDMAVDLVRTDLKGQAPLLMAFAARTGHRVLSFRHVMVQDDGTLAVLDSAPKKPAPTAKNVTGVKLELLDEATGNVKELYYFSVDVANGNMAAQKSFQSYLRSLAPTSTYIKSASYLMHKEYFSTIRSLIQEVSLTILQDDSGMPLKAFDKNVWDVKLYGGYTRPIDLFANMYQADLRAAYQADTTITKLDFIIGYGGKPSNLLLARKKAK